MERGLAKNPSPKSELEACIWHFDAPRVSHPVDETPFAQADLSVPIMGSRPPAGGPPCRLPLRRLAPFAGLPAARSFAIRAMSFTGTGLVSGKWTVPFRSS